MAVLDLLLILPILLTGSFSPESLQPAYPILDKTIFASSLPTVEPAITLQTPPRKKLLESNYFVVQSYNNCGPASLSMALKYHGINQDQETLADALRPHRNNEGINDDKSVTLKEMAEKAEEYDLIAYHRPNGSLEQMKLFIAYDMPIITKEWLNESEDIGHYRVVRGYDDETQEVIQDDSYTGKNLRYSYTLFEELWGKFNYEYLVLVPKEKQHIAEKILGEDANEALSWKKAVRVAQEELKADPESVASRFNLVVAYYNIGENKKAVTEFEKIENRLSERMLWYQTEPLQAYFKLGNYDKVFSLSEKILTNENLAFSELYLLRGKIYSKEGKINEAKEEFEKALYYNKNFTMAKQALKDI